mgnify:CR=1 FL=1
MTASMEMHDRDLTPRGLPGTWARRTAVAGVSAAVVATLTATPAAAEPRHPSATDATWASRAAAHSLYVTAGGQITGADGYIVINDGVTATVRGVTTPDLPVIDNQRHAVVGVLGQDAYASVTGQAAACAGVVGRGGTLKIGSDQSCLVSGSGTVQVSLGTLNHLGLGAILGGELPGLPELPQLPDLPVPVPGSPEVPVPGIPDLPVPELGAPERTGVELPDAKEVGVPGLPDLELPDLPELNLPVADLPDVELAVVAKGITARCLVSPTEIDGTTDIAHASVVAIVDGQQIPLADLPPDGLTLSLDQLLVALQNHLPDEVNAIIGEVLMALPTEKLDDVQLVDIQVDAQATVNGQITVTALGVQTAYPGLFDLALGTVTCASNPRLASPMPQPGPQALAGAKAGEADDPAVTGEGRAEGAEASATRPDTDARATEGDGAAKRGAGEGDATASADLAPAASTNPLVPVGGGLVLAVILAAVGVALLKLRPRRTHN